MSLFLREEVHGAALVAFTRNGEDALAMQGMARLVDRHVPEERMNRSKTSVARPERVASLGFKVVEKVAHELCVDLLEKQVGEAVATAKAQG